MISRHFKDLKFGHLSPKIIISLSANQTDLSELRKLWFFKNFVDTSGELGAGTADCDLKMPLESAQLRFYHLLYIVSAMFRHKFANSRLQMHHNILPQSPRSELNCECFNNPRTQQREKTFHIFLEIFGKRKHWTYLNKGTELTAAGLQHLTSQQ